MRNNKAFAIIITALLIAILAWFAFSIYSIFTGVAKQVSNLATPDALVLPAQYTKPAVANTPVISAQEAPVEATQPTTQVAAQTASETPVYTYADIMSVAGIASADYGYVTDMVLGDHGWRTTGPNLWQYATRNASEGMLWNLRRVNHYVSVTYGSWTAAHDAWVSGGDF